MAKLSKQFIEKSKEIRGLAKDKRYSDDDCTNLYLNAKVTSVHSWLYRFKVDKRADSFTIGKYQDISLTEARELARSYNKMLAQGKNPKIEKENLKIKDKDYFCGVAIEYLDSKHPNQPNGFNSLETYKKSVSYYKRILLPIFKNYRLNDIKRRHITNLLKEQTANNQSKIKNLISQIFEYAIDNGISEEDHNPALKAKTDPITTDGFRFVDPIDDKYNFSKLMNSITDFNKGDISTIRALQLAPYLGLRPGNLVSLKWEYLDTKDMLLKIPGEEMKMKGRPAFKQPLSKQAYKIIESMREITGHREYIFYSSRSKDKHITATAVGNILKDDLLFNGIDNPKQHTHGFRKTVRTYISYIKSKHGWDRDSVRMILSHLKDDKVDEIYDKNQFVDERRDMLQIWADYVDDIKENSNITKLENIS